MNYFENFIKNNRQMCPRKNKRNLNIMRALKNREHLSNNNNNNSAFYIKLFYIKSKLMIFEFFCKFTNFK